MILIWLESISESQSDSWEGFMAITWQRIHLKENEDRERKCMETTEKENGPIQRDKGERKNEEGLVWIKWRRRECRNGHLSISPVTPLPPKNWGVTDSQFDFLTSNRFSNITPLPQLDSNNL